MKTIYNFSKSNFMAPFKRIPVLTFAAILISIAAYGLIFTNTAYAARMYLTQNEKTLFGYAARDFWDSRMGPPNVTDPNTDHFATDFYSQATCKPKNMKYTYFYSSRKTGQLSNPNVIAYTSPKSAYNQASSNKRHDIYVGGENYCKVGFNRDNYMFANLSLTISCDAFIHEYGHALSLQHVSAKNSIMAAKHTYQGDGSGYYPAVARECAARFPKP